MASMSSGTDSTYKELKHVRWYYEGKLYTVPILPIRNWNVLGVKKYSFVSECTDSTYKELKLV